MKKNSFALVICITLFILFLVCSCETELSFIEYSKESDTKSPYQSIDFSYTHVDDKSYEKNASYGGKKIQYDNGYIYFFNRLNSNQQIEGATLMQLDPKTGIILPVCPDPICSHNSPECPFFGYGRAFYASNDSFYIRREYRYFVYDDEGNRIDTIVRADLIRYDSTKDKVTVYEDYGENFESYLYNYQLYIDNYQYYYDYVLDKEAEEYCFKICRRDIDTGESVTLGGEINKETVYERFLFELDGRIYITDGKKIYSVNYDWEDRCVEFEGNFSRTVLTDGKEIFFSATDKNGEFEIHKMSFDGTETDLNITDNGMWILTENYIYYVSDDEYMVGNTRLYGSALYRCDHNGNNTELVCEFKDGDKYLRISSECVIDNYFYSFLKEYNAEGELISDREKILRVDVSTGEKYYFDIWLW